MDFLLFDRLPSFICGNKLEERERERDGINSSTNEKFDSAIIIAYRLILFFPQIFNILFLLLLPPFDN